MRLPETTVINFVESIIRQWLLAKLQREMNKSVLFIRCIKLSLWLAKIQVFHLFTMYMFLLYLSYFVVLT